MTVLVAMGRFRGSGWVSGRELLVFSCHCLVGL